MEEVGNDNILISMNRKDFEFMINIMKQYEANRDKKRERYRASVGDKLVPIKTKDTYIKYKLVDTSTLRDILSILSPGQHSSS